MKPIPYYDRKTKATNYEKVYAGKALAFLYSGSALANFLKKLVSKNAFVSCLVGYWKKQGWTKKNIVPFIQEHHVDPEEFLLSPKDFVSFNDFFIRKLKKEARPIETSDAIIPADARYLFYEKIDDQTDFIVKGERLDLKKLLVNEALVDTFEGGSAIVARLCPSDYHRFHFPVDCIPGKPELINGPLYSVNPIAIKQNLNHLIENKRIITLLESRCFGKIAYIEIGATNVGSIQQTFTPGIAVQKGDEKGYFEFGGSSLILLFQKNTIEFSDDLMVAAKSGYEIRCLMGQSMGNCRNNVNIL